MSNKDQSKLLGLLVGWVLDNKIGDDPFRFVVEKVVLSTDLFEIFKFDKVVSVGTKLWFLEIKFLYEVVQLELVLEDIGLVISKIICVGYLIKLACIKCASNYV